MMTFTNPRSSEYPVEPLFLDRWSPPVPDDDDPAALARFVARLAADGLWVHEAMSNRPLPAKLKERVCRELVTMAESMTRDSKNS